MKNKKPLIFDIKRHALEDGPGIRTTVFFKGCNLHCIWCQNPESIDPDLEIAFYPKNCIKCYDCLEVCHSNAIKKDRPLKINRTLCDRCGECVKICPSRSLKQVGHFYPIDNLVSILLRDKIFYEVSGGGITLSGGEPTLHMDYISPFLKILKRKGLHTAIQTNGFFNWHDFREKLLPWLDLVMFDVKLIDPQRHLKYTGQKNDIILKNLVCLTKKAPEKLLPRTPLIPYFTATTENLKAISELYQRLGIKRCSLLSYNPTWFSKAESIGKKVSPELSKHFTNSEEEKKLRKIFSWAELVD